MSTPNGQTKQSRKKTMPTPDVKLYVAPGDGKASRLVVAQWGDMQFTDKLDPYKALGARSTSGNSPRRWISKTLAN